MQQKLPGRSILPAPATPVLPPAASTAGKNRNNRIRNTHPSGLLSVLLSTGLALSGLVTAGAEVPQSVMGLWRGEWIDPDKANDSLRVNPELTAEVIGLGDDQFRVRFMSETFKRAEILFETTAQLRDGSVRFDTDKWRGEITAETLTGEALVRGDRPVAFKLTPYLHPSPTLGLPPPEGATVLFDGSGLDAWSGLQGGEAPCRIAEDGSLEIVPKKPGETGKRDVRTRRDFGDVRMHIEFLIPYTPARGGQGRGNSGVFLQGAYEVQVLDSFGSDGLWNECGALYKVSPPRVNACLPPGQWQTYDIEFRAARTGPDGRVITFPKMTVLQNGIPIHTAFELRERTSHSMEHRRQPPVAEPGPILLQEHGHPVRYRNIWVEPLDGPAPQSRQPKE